MPDKFVALGLLAASVSFALGIIHRYPVVHVLKIAGKPLRKRLIITHNTHTYTCPTRFIRTAFMINQLLTGVKARVVRFGRFRAFE